MITDKKKELGAFYTPDLVTDAMCEWAINNTDDFLLEPSFGGCNFLVSSINRLNTIGCKKSKSQIYGYDIDSEAFNILNKKGLSNPNFFNKDFLKSTNQELPNKVSVILGNPPYLPINKLSTQYRKEVLENVSFRELTIGKRSSLWIYFIVKSLGFLKANGKMAWIVPDSIYFTEYGKFFLEGLAKYFASIRLLRIKERFFFESGTHEKTCILLCDGFDQKPSGLEVFNYDKLSEALHDLSKKEFKSVVEYKYTEPIISPSFHLTTLGEIFDIRIGIVIGV